MAGLAGPDNEIDHEAMALSFNFFYFLPGPSLRRIDRASRQIGSLEELKAQVPSWYLES